MNRFDAQKAYVVCMLILGFFIILPACGGVLGRGRWDLPSVTVSSTIPANAATGLAINSAVTATFSGVIDPATVTETTFILKQGTTPVSGTVSNSGVTALFKPASNLAVNTAYTATITTGVKNLAGHALANNFVWNFITGAIADTIPPTVSFTVLIDTATSIASNGVINATFSEAIDPLTISIATFTVKANVPGTINSVGTSVTFTPLNNLALSNNYTATIKGGLGGATDLAGNPLAVDKVWSFTTGAEVKGFSSGAVKLGTTGTSGILATSAVTNTGFSLINGDVSLDPGTSMIGFPPGLVNGTIHLSNTVTAQSKNKSVDRVIL